MNTKTALDRSSLDTARVLATIARMLREITFSNAHTEEEIAAISRRLEAIATDLESPVSAGQSKNGHTNGLTAERL